MVRAAVLLGLAVATPVGARTIRSVLGDAQELVGIRPSPAFARFAKQFTTVGGELLGPAAWTSAPAAAPGATIDATMALRGPIFLDHAEPLGAGATNVALLGQRALGDASLFGQNLGALGAGVPGLTVLQRSPTGNPTSPALTGVRLRYALDLRVRTATLVASYGLTDALDVSVVVPVVSSRLDCAVRADVVRASTPMGFVRVPGTQRAGSARPVASTGLGDVVLRLKYGLPTALVPPPLRAALTVTAQFPTGDPDEVHGAGAYWLTPTLVLTLPLVDKRAELAAALGLAFALSDARRSEASYGLSASAVLWPGRLAAVAEFLGRSQLDTAFAPHATDTLGFVGGSFVPIPLLGVDYTQRLDVFDFAFGFRAILWSQIALFVAGSIPLNSAVALRPAGITPTIGVGARF